MTLITHLRNKNICLIAGDSKATDIHSHINAKKVYKLTNGIVGYYGLCTNHFYYWLIRLDEGIVAYSVEDIINEFSSTIHENKYTGHFSIVISTTENSILLTSRYNQSLEIPSVNNNVDRDLNQILKKPIFFSPMRDDMDEEFCLKHNEGLEKLFKECFNKVYDRPFNFEELDNDEKLREFFSLFYREIHLDNFLNVRHYIAGPVKFYLIDLANNITSELFIDEKF
jgi:hypothetical protein